MLFRDTVCFCFGDYIGSCCPVCAVPRDVCTDTSIYTGKVTSSVYCQESFPGTFTPEGRDELNSFGNNLVGVRNCISFQNKSVDDNCCVLCKVSDCVYW